MLIADAVHADYVPILRFFQQARIRLQVQRLSHITGKLVGRHKDGIDPAPDLVANLIQLRLNSVSNGIRQYFILFLPDGILFCFVFV